MLCNVHVSHVLVDLTECPVPCKVHRAAGRGTARGLQAWCPSSVRGYGSKRNNPLFRRSRSGRSSRVCCRRFPESLVGRCGTIATHRLRRAWAWDPTNLHSCPRGSPGGCSSHGGKQASRKNVRGTLERRLEICLSQQSRVEPRDFFRPAAAEIK